MFKFVPDTGVPGFRVGLAQGGARRAPAGYDNTPTVDDYPYSDAMLAFGDPRGVGIQPPSFSVLGGLPARPAPLETLPRIEPGPGPYIPPLPVPPWRRGFSFPWPSGEPDPGELHFDFDRKPLFPPRQPEPEQPPMFAYTYRLQNG
jgi:hypothetical protein